MSAFGCTRSAQRMTPSDFVFATTYGTEPKQSRATSAEPTLVAPSARGWRVVLSLLVVIAAVIAGVAAGALTGGSNTAPDAAVQFRALLARAERATVEVEAGTQKGPDGVYPSNDHQSEFGSGFFISPTEVMTAGHVVYAASKKQRPNRSPLYVLTPSGDSAQHSSSKSNKRRPEILT